MPDTATRKVVYLLGAGATHAELMNLDPDLTDGLRGLLVSNLSSRVIDKARRDPRYLKGVEMVSGTSGSLNIELLITLIENSKIHNWARKTSRLKQLVEQDIKSILTASRMRRFYLHKALLELHERATTKRQEQLTALITLNYDDVLDQAYGAIHSRPPDYCFSLAHDSDSSPQIPLLKLHGSFNWKRRHILSRPRTIEIIPLGSSKTYLHAPYGFIWNRALYELTRCDVLRVIGCSLSQNDGHLIDLLFKAHLERLQPFDIEVIDRDATAIAIKAHYGFFPNITMLSELPHALIPESDPTNPFKTWLKYMTLALVPTEQLPVTRYLKKVVI